PLLRLPRGPGRVGEDGEAHLEQGRGRGDQLFGLARKRGLQDAQLPPVQVLLPRRVLQPHHPHLVGLQQHPPALARRPPRPARRHLAEVDGVVAAHHGDDLQVPQPGLGLGGVHGPGGAQLQHHGLPRGQVHLEKALPRGREARPVRAGGGPLESPGQALHPVRVLGPQAQGGRVLRLQLGGHEVVVRAGLLGPRRGWRRGPRPPARRTPLGGVALALPPAEPRARGPALLRARRLVLRQLGVPVLVLPVVQLQQVSEFQEGGLEAREADPRLRPVLQLIQPGRVEVGHALGPVPRADRGAHGRAGGGRGSSCGCVGWARCNRDPQRSGTSGFRKILQLPRRRYSLGGCKGQATEVGGPPGRRGGTVTGRGRREGPGQGGATG
uniref:Uncharacterized protein n=1 Tax=Mustela putorius furo TaxID=9669 RepID=M3Z5J9_MUSPF